MTIEESLKELILERFGTVSEFCKEIGMANSTFATIMKNGIHSANINNVIKICKALDISTDELAHNRIIPKGSQLAGEAKLEDLYAFIRTTIKSSQEITFNGKTLPNDVREAFIDALDLSMEFLRRNI